MQSITLNIDVSIFNPMANSLVNLEAYGATEEEAKKNMLEVINDLKSAIEADIIKPLIPINGLGERIGSPIMKANKSWYAV